MGLFGKKKKKTTGFDIGDKLKNIKVLISTKRSKEAIAYQYMLFTMLATAKFKVRKHPSESIRDYAMKIVKEYNINPKNLYPFVQSVEEVIYGGKKPSKDAYNHSIGLFGNVFEEIVGKPLPPMKI